MAPPSTLDGDDLDDLDDVLDQFSRQPAPPTPTTAGIPTSPLTSPPPPPPSATAPTFGGGRPRTNTRVDGPPVPAPGNGLPTLGENDEDQDVLAADFAKELAAGMENLMREIAAANPGAGESESGEGEVDAEAEAARFKAAWEAMMIQDMDAAQGQPDAGASTSAGAAADGDFQAKIRAAMHKLNEGESTLQSDSAASGSGPAPDSLEALLAQLSDLGGEGGSDLPADEAELAGFLENMMGELMSKEVLHEPLSELADKFPPYLAAHTPTSTPPLPAADRTRYEAQLARVRDILAIFDAPDFNDDDKEKREKVVALMAEMQSFGSRPPNSWAPSHPASVPLAQRTDASSRRACAPVFGCGSVQYIGGGRGKDV
ncbi:Pex19 protein family-domain-containing protein [Mycena galopus ATCC 62051]|nr:Pex19 protein family-domain-containing protein [Mycena galopus ATCC 62051]